MSCQVGAATLEPHSFDLGRSNLTRRVNLGFFRGAKPMKEAMVEPTPSS